MNDSIVQIENISKRFPGVLALDGVNLDIQKGECHGLVGENGAGKSTLGKIIAGVYKHDTGVMKVKGKKVKFAGVYDATDKGIGIVHQELLFCENMTVAENLCLGRFPGKCKLVSSKKMTKLANEWLSWIGIDIDVNETLGNLSVSHQQIVQIAAAISKGADVIIFDEPTSSLSRAESERLFALIDKLKKDNVTLIYVSHRMEELFQLCDRITVLRDGKLIDTRKTSDYNHDSLIEQMIGRSLEAYFPGHLNCKVGRVALSVENLSSPGKFSNINFQLRAGEVLGLGGLVGAGRTEIAEALFGLDSKVKGRISFASMPKKISKTSSALNFGVGLIPEDRKRHGLAFNLNACQNITLPILKKLSRFTWIRKSKEEKLAEKYFKILKVKAPNIHSDTSGLSGGNQQKLIIARWIAAGCKILLVDEPTRGVDVGAKSEIHSLIDKLSQEGAAVLLISSDMPELLNLSTRIIVLREGEMVGELSRKEFDQERLMRMMSGLENK
jgi:ABC-type sugar transport system ATPase subunit